MLNIVIPMAGRGSRFADAGYKIPKPLIPVHGIPMIELVVANLTPSTEHRFIFICQERHVGEYGLKERFRTLGVSAEIVTVPEVTGGAACTVLAARSIIDCEEPLMIANSDQYIDVSIDDYVKWSMASGRDGGIMTMTASDPKWSFVGLDANGLVNKVVEKEVISTEATVGIYNFTRGKDFVHAADEMIRLDKRVNGEFYVAPCYNELIQKGFKIGFLNIGADGHGMYGLGTPHDLDLFLANPLSRRATSFQHGSH